jgi:hypothetical protein
MVALRRAGGPGQQFRYTWQGGRIAAQLQAAIAQGMEDEAKEIAEDLKATLHRWPESPIHYLAEDSFAVVEVRGGRRTLVLGSDAPYTVYHELEPDNHPQIREMADKHAPHITQRIKEAAARIR